MMDVDQFEERAAIMEFDGGLDRFRAETLAAQAQGKTRWEVLNEIRNRHSAGRGDSRQTVARDTTDTLPTVQRNAAQQERHMPERDVQA
jgi:hypothetical protein